ncbi:MAG TPA: hypothetical protein PKY82_03995 [Pyrinomonadaceae bacterium]|nr:hypothetical protein [Pyrinomonadaceae bacterium]
MRKVLFKIFIGLMVIGVLLGIWIVFDLYRPHKVDIREFDADEIARLDTEMWRSYYAKERLEMFSQLTEVLEKQYKLPFWRRQLMAYYAAKSAFVFKDGKSREDYEKALPDLRKFYSEIRDISTTEFEVERVAKTELEWWIIHRDRKKYQEGDLANALAEAASAIYNVPKEKLLEYGKFRADAMKIRDDKAEQGGVTEEDWQKIDELLHNSWRSLHKNVN